MHWQVHKLERWTGERWKVALQKKTRPILECVRFLRYEQALKYFLEMHVEVDHEYLLVEVGRHNPIKILQRRIIISEETSSA